MSPQNNTMQAPASGVTVRMYNTGFGDCLLLAFRARDGSARYMLIDCGVHHTYSGGASKIRKVVRDIMRATTNHLHVVAVTHEHTDHLYGFKYAREIFENVRIDELWLAWTENPTDKISKNLKQLHGMKIRALTAAVSQLRLSNDPLGGTLQGLLDFEYPNALSATGGNPAQLQYLRTKSRKKLRRAGDYRRPGERPLTLSGVDGVKIYVLGPPRDVDWIKMLEKESEMYLALRGTNEVTAFAAAALATEGTDTLSNEDRELLRRSRPFDESLEISKNAASTHPHYGAFFRNHYGFSRRNRHGPEWRRVETDWLAAAEQLALQIDSYTNNTSLVLAIELTEVQPRKALLFAADAQIGNWLSWHELSWPGEGEDSETIRGEDLLRRTVLYKVGHHGSHNATASESGLEMMDSPDLIAMIPVDKEWAYGRRPPWKHPDEDLLARLKQKTEGRVIRTDEIPSGNRPPKKPRNVNRSEWQSFIRKLDWDRSGDKLWIQVTVPG
ncbi:MAG TPA: hypothetical protein G4O11_09125 [Anaerolineae bacterium]|nr:hypothetical protein [Anaerolineae bacterium]